MTEHFPPRTSKRAPIETRVRFRFADLEDFEVRQSGDISLGGMFLKGDNPAPVGTRVDFEFVLTDATELIRGTGEVVWSREEGTPEAPAGMGIRFLKLSPGSRAIIFHAVDRWIQQGNEPFDVEQEAPDEEPEPAAQEPEPAAQVPEPAAEPPSRPAAAAATTEGDPSQALSELVARATGKGSETVAPDVLAPGATSPEREVDDDPDAGDLSSTRVRGVAFVQDEPAGTRWGRLALIAAVAVLFAGAAGFVWLQDHDPSPASTETSTVGAPAAAVPEAAEEATATRPVEPEESDAVRPPALEDSEETGSELAETASEPPSDRPVTRLEEIRWDESNEGTEVVLVGDGSFELQRWTRFHLAGPNPREVVKIRGVESPYERSYLPVGSPELRQVRTGFHTLPGSSELHVVLDLTDPRVEATQVEASGRTLRIRLTGPRS